MKSIQLTIMVLLVSCSGFAQNSAIFTGGVADGWVKAAFQQSANNIFSGGGGDGWEKTVYVQSSNNIFTGGLGDGWDKTVFAQTVNNIFAGGAGDGWDKTAYAQPINNIFSGGNGDGWDKTSFAQGLNNIFNGGAGDGWDKISFAQGGNNIFSGGIGDGWSSTYRPMAPLPVTMLYFTAVKNSQSSSLLEWKTSQEVNSLRFDVERSNDAVNFVKIGMVNAAGNSQLPIVYNFIDNNPMAGNNYYRLKQVDADGRSVYTPARLVRFNESADADIHYYPNPTHGVLYIELPIANTNQMVINITNAAGIVVTQLRLSSAANRIISVDLSKYPKGVYFVQLFSKQYNSTQRIILQ